MIDSIVGIGILIKYEPFDWLNISLGRGHTALGFWNQNFHHGTHLQTTIERPHLYKFEHDGGILPIHFVGLEFSGNVEAPLGLITYSANIANGKGKTVSEVQLVEDANNEKMFSFMFTLEPKVLEGFGIGWNILYDVIPNDPATPGRQNEIKEFMVGAHLYYIDQTIEFISEFQVIEHEELRDFNHNGGYAQLAYRFGKGSPYYRFDFLNIENGDPFYSGLAEVEDRQQHTVGFRFDWFVYSALKLEYRYLDSDSGISHFVSGQVSFAF